MLDRIPECKTLSERRLRERQLNTSVIVRNSRKFQSARPPREARAPPREEGSTPAYWGWSAESLFQARAPPVRRRAPPP
jgi:hypothetical protein